MGRHSRPEDVEDGTSLEDSTSLEDAPSSTAEVAGRPTPRGRHSAADENGSPVVAAEQPVPRPKPSPRPSISGTAADVRLIRDHGDVRNRCIAAILVPFVVFTVAMFAIGRADDYLFWVWLPTIIAGVLVGTILDHAHKRYPDG